MVLHMNDFMFIGMALINATCRSQNRPDAVDTSVNCHSIRTWIAAWYGHRPWVILDAWCLIKNKTRNLKFQIKYMFWVLYFIRKNYNLEDILAGTLNITRNAKKLRENKVRGILQMLAKQHGVKVSAKTYSFEMVEKKLSFRTKWDSPLHLMLILKLDQRMVRKTQQLPAEEELGVGGSNNKN